jgi:hypothetical protein
MGNDNVIVDRMNRIKRSVNLEKQDRVPVVLEYAGFAAHITQTLMSDFVRSPRHATDIMIQAYQMIGEGDGTPTGVCERQTIQCQKRVGKNSCSSAVRGRYSHAI